MEPIVIGKVRNPSGSYGNMAPFPIQHLGLRWATNEALFQALRFESENIREVIRKMKNPMMAKLVAKEYSEDMVVKPMSEQDVDNMRLCLKLKAEQHPVIKKSLVESDDAFIVEDCSKRQGGSGLFWGAALKNGEWVGENKLGKLWMELRELFKNE
jgi:predicted NAD-dependent protein-ADP-ribosyltransferase YbiA (DUF1768 family)